MSCLHTISRSPSQGLLQTCASVLQAGDAVLFIEDGVYHCLQYDPWPALHSQVKIFGLSEDIQARGLLSGCSSAIEIVNYDRFVALCCEHNKVVSWF